MKILVVDDAQVQRFITIKMLTELGYTDIIGCSSAEEAVIQLKDVEINLILSDLHMGGANGLWLLEYVRNNKMFSSIPFIMITSDHEKKMVLQALKLGLQNYLFKPVLKPDLASKLRDLSAKFNFQPPQ